MDAQEMDKFDKLTEAIHEMQLGITKLTAHIESELGGSKTQGNIHRQLNGLDESVKEINESLQGESGHGSRIRAIETENEKLKVEIEDLETWMKSMSEIASPSQFKDMKTELDSQRTKWIIAGTLFALAQFGVGIAIKVFM